MYDRSNRMHMLFSGAPIRLRWNGFTSDTHTLNARGWTMNAEEHPDHEYGMHAVRLIAVSPDKMLMMSGQMNIDYRTIHPMTATDLAFRQEELYHYGIEMKQYNVRDRIEVMPAQEWASYAKAGPIDVHKPTFWAGERIDFHNLRIFAPLEEKENEIYIPPNNVDELFNHILKLQYPEQQKIKSSLILPEAKPIVQAKIFSLAA